MDAHATHTLNQTSINRVSLECCFLQVQAWPFLPV